MEKNASDGHVAYRAELYLKYEEKHFERLEINDKRRGHAFLLAVWCGIGSFILFILFFVLTFFMVMELGLRFESAWHLVIFPVMLGAMTISLFFIASKLIYKPFKLDRSDGSENREDGARIMPVPFLSAQLEQVDKMMGQ